MSCTCKNKCQGYPGYRNVSGKRLKDGRLCRTCEAQFIYDGNWCPCCGVRLRYTVRRKSSNVPMEARY